MIFNNVKATFNERVLSHPDFNLVFYLQTDAGKLGLGAKLFQVDGERLVSQAEL